MVNIYKRMSQREGHPMGLFVFFVKCVISYLLSVCLTVTSFKLSTHHLPVLPWAKSSQGVVTKNQAIQKFRERKRVCVCV